MIAFTNSETGKALYVNPDRINYIIPTQKGIVINFGDNTFVIVGETEDEVIAKLYRQQLNPFTSTGNYEKL